MKVVVISQFPTRGRAAHGGVEGHVVRLVTNLRQRGVVLTVMAPGTTDSMESTASMQIFRIRCDQRLALPLRLRTWRAGVSRALRGLNPDIVHGHGLLAAGVAASDWSRSPSVVTAHGNIACDALALYRGISGELRAKMAVSLARQAATRVQAVIGVSRDWKVNVPATPRRYVHIPPIVDPLFERITRTPIPGQVLFCGGSHPIKGWQLLSAAWPRVVEAIPTSRLEVLAWDGHPTGRDDTDTIRYRAHLAPGELCSAMAHAAVVVVPSSFEVTPTVIAEAWAIGVPVIATAVGGVPAMAEGAARLVPPDNAEALADAIIETLSCPRREFIAAGRRRLRLHNADYVVDRHMTIYDELLTLWRTS
jgi:glycogen synthase